MANEYRGEVSLDGPDGELKLKFTTNAICEFEKLHNKPVLKVFSDIPKKMETPTYLIRDMFFAALLEFQPGTTPKDAGNLMDEIGLERVTDAVMDALEASTTIFGVNPPDPSVPSKKKNRGRKKKK